MNQTTNRPTVKKSRGASLGNGSHAPVGVLDTPSFKQPDDPRLRLILGAMIAFRDGDFSVRLPSDWLATEGQIAGAFNQVIAQKQRISKEVTRLSETVGKEG